MEFKPAASFPESRLDGDGGGGGGGTRDERGAGVVLPGVASGSKMEGGGALVELPLFTGKVFDPLMES